MTEANVKNPNALSPSELALGTFAVNSKVGDAGTANEARSLKDTLPCTIYGANVTPAVLEDFDNQEIDGLVYKAGPAPFKVDAGYDGWYRKPFGWGDYGAGIYAYTSHDTTAAYKETYYDKVGRESHLSKLRISEAPGSCRMEHGEDWLPRRLART